MSPTIWKLRQGSAAVVVVLALHLAVLAGALRLGVWPERTAPKSRPPLTVQLIWQHLTTVAPPAEQAQPAARTVQPKRTTRAVQPDQPAPADTPAAAEPALQAITLPATAPTEPGAPATASASAPPLNLALPRGASAPWRSRLQALDDPRSNTPRLTMEQKLAMAMGGDGNWVEEVIDADHRRLRRGNMCVYLQRSAAAQLDPFHPASRNSPWQASQPTRC